MNTENTLGTAPIPGLLMKFGIPSIVSFLITSIYNMTDQVFIGQSVGALGNAATNVVFPFVTLASAIGLMICAGTAADVSLSLGRGLQDRAERIMANGLALSLIAGVILCAAGEVFLTPLLYLFGSTDSVLPYAKSYGEIIFIGTPFVMLGFAANYIIRSDGNPRYAMISNLVGAVINIILDPIFIFVFKWGVAGAAIATIFSQFVVMVMNLTKLKNLKTLTFRAQYIRLKLSAIGTICSLGFASFITQATMVLVQITINNSAVVYGAASKYGAEIPLACFGIVFKVIQLMTAVIFGLCVSTQPIFGFNFGARKFDRVKKLLFITLGICIAVSIIGMAVLLLFPQQIIGLFGQESPLYIEFAVMFIRIISIFMPFMAFQLLSGVYYQAIGNPKAAIILTLSRQVLFLLPPMILLPRLIGITGIMYAFPISDLLAAVLGGVMIFRAVRDLTRSAAANVEC